MGLKDVKIFCYCLGAWFSFGTAIGYVVLSMFDFIKDMDSYVMMDPGFNFMYMIMNEMIGYCWYLLIFGVGYIVLGYFLEKLGKNALLIHIVLSAGLLTWGVIVFLIMYPKAMQFTELMPQIEGLEFVNTFQKYSMGFSIVMGAVQFVFPQFFLGRMIWKKTYNIPSEVVEK